MNKDLRFNAILWSQGKNESITELEARYKQHLKKLERQRRVKAEIVKRQEESSRALAKQLHNIRSHYMKTGRVEGKIEGAQWRFMLGHHHRNGRLEIYEESQARLHPKKFVVSLWRSPEALKDYERKRKQNDRFIAEQRKKNVPDMQAVQKVPYPNISHLASAVCDLNLTKIQRLIKENRESRIDEFGILPRRSFVAYEDHIGDCGVLELKFK